MGGLVRRRLGTVVIIAALLVLFSANRVAVLLTDLWWFTEIGFREVFTTVLSTRIVLGLVFGFILAALIAGNLLLVRKLRPFTIPSSPQQAQIQRYRDMADPYLPWIIIAIAIVFGFTSGLAISAQWETVLLWLNSTEVGIADPQFGADIGFYLFELPFWLLLQTWLFTSLILTGLLSAGAHYLLGGIRPEAEGEKILPGVKAHLAIVLSAILAVWAWGHWLGRFELNYSQRGTVTGASYTDVNAELPALYLLIGVSVIAIGLVLYSIRRQGFLLPGAALGLLVVASIILQGAYPAAIQRLQVDPQELAREQMFIERNLEATRAAYGLDEVGLQPFTISDDLTEDEVIENEVTIRNIRLWDPEVLETTYAELQALRPYYQFGTVSIDRYTIDGELRQVMLSTRELSQLPSEADSWQNRHTFFTHGFGVVASQVNTANPEGQPVFISRNIPPEGDAPEVVPEDQPGVYFGESPNPQYALVRTEAPELDFEDPDTREQVLTQYAGDGGVPIDNFARRTAFALRFNDYNILLTNFLTDESRIIFNRQIQERVQQVAPFLELDASPYPAVINGRVTWIQDAYTTSNAYPYSERQALNLAGQRALEVNYVRNSVKVAVDAYDGGVTLYRVEDDDPILDAWEGVFPDLITPMDEAPEEVVRHFRYPQDLFRLQSDLYQSYHIPGAAAFYNRADAWELPNDPAFAANQGAGGDLAAGSQRRLDPYYLLMRLPGETTEEFVLIQPYLARERPNMVAWLAGRSDGEHINQLFGVRFPSGTEVLGPQQAQARIEQDDDISAYITLRDREGSSVIRGNLQVLPIENSILYVQPLFLENPQARIPELARVVLVMGGRTAFDRTLTGALAQLLDIEVPEELLEEEAREAVVDPVTGEEDDAPPDDDAPDDDEPTDQTSTDLIIDALRAFNRAEQALSEGSLGRYQTEVARAQDLLERAAEIEGISVQELFGVEPDETDDQDLLDEFEEADEDEDG